MKPVPGSLRVLCFQFVSRLSYQSESLRIAAASGVVMGFGVYRARQSGDVSDSIGAWRRTNLSRRNHGQAGWESSDH